MKQYLERFYKNITYYVNALYYFINLLYRNATPHPYRCGMHSNPFVIIFTVVIYVKIIENEVGFFTSTGVGPQRAQAE